MVKEQIVVDAKGHLKGRLASYVAKQLLLGQKIVVVRCEQMIISGSLYRNKLNYMEFMHKTMNSNPKKGVQHHRAPSRIIWRCIRGMLPHKTKRGAAALGRLKCFDGCPLTYNAKKKLVIPDALKIVRLKPRSRHCVQGDVSKICGWNSSELVKELEVSRAVRNRKWFTAKQDKLKAKCDKLKKVDELNKINKELEAYGY